jgi:hypothetical protein
MMYSIWEVSMDRMTKAALMLIAAGLWANQQL